MNHAPRTTNRLAFETSPYLLQHAHNPVDWYPWGEEAFARASSEDKPILLSVGYSACHWCHVMERESFDNESVARLMNESFVCIKVDREERPDIDGIYMMATITLRGSGGWPMTVFLTPEREPFFAGTYFPPDERFGRPGFRTLLHRISELWKRERSTLLQQASELTRAIRTTRTSAGSGRVGQTAIDQALARLHLSFDERFGGFGDAPKFPPHSALTLLLRHTHRTSDARAESMLRQTLDAMAAGGIHDHLGGGFARYSTDARWFAPHFEKMLYDNAQLGRIYAEASVVLSETKYEGVARRILDYVLREMQDSRGGFYSATDADSEGEEGRYFVWTQDELVDELGAESAACFAAFYGVTALGNWEGKNILYAARSLDAVATDLDMPPDELATTLERAREVLLEARRERVPPALDDKVLASHSALMVSALAEAARLFGETRYLEAAERASGFILREMRREDGGLLRTWRAGTAKIPGFLDDYAYLADALIDLYEAGGAAELLATAKSLALRIVSEFSDEDMGDYYTTTAEHDGLLFRAKEVHDGAIPSATAIAARSLVRLGRYFEAPALIAQAHRALRAQAELLEKSPHAALTTLSAIDLALEPPVELVLVGDPSSTEYQALARAVGREYLPNRVLAHHNPENSGSEAELAIVKGKTLAHGKPALYVCRDGACEAPLTSPADVAGAIRAAKTWNVRSRGVSVGRPRLEGSATVEGTERFARRCATRLPSSTFNEMATGLRVSKLGFAAERFGSRSAEKHASLRDALDSGINLVEVNPHGPAAETEALVGEGLAELCASGACSRDEIVILSRVGPIRGRALARLRQRSMAGEAAVQTVVLDDALEYSLDPKWLEHQLSESLDRLGLSCIDGYLVSEPELLLAARPNRGDERDEVAGAAFSRSLLGAFRHLEEEVARGRIRFYGVSTSSGRVEPAGGGGFDRVLDAARAAGGTAHRFKLLEVPLNLLEQGAIEPSNGAVPGTRSLLEVAGAAGISVLTNRPLVVHWDGTTLRLRDDPEAPAQSAPEAIAALAAAEAEFRAQLAPSLRVSGGTESALTLFEFAHELQEALDGAKSAEQVEELYLQRIAPRVAATVRAIDSAFQTAGGERWKNWRDGYIATLTGTIASLRHAADARARTVVQGLRAVLGEGSADFERNAGLAARVLWLTSHLPGVVSTLVEWGWEADLGDGAETLKWPTAASSVQTFEAATRTLESLRAAWVTGAR